MSGRIVRITMFKIPEVEKQQGLFEQYKILAKTQQKDGKPYILSMNAGPAMDDPRSQGVTVVSKTEFTSLDDMKYYEEECAAHKELKKFNQANQIAKPMTVYFAPQVVA
ncbi:Stress responsive A/B Barrel domain-containing protein [Zalerion maritima]|uniref:Stress responsive A/B Barrel domain-containing protein n=1 Tax=Zalerion maritima TaxID=339359 RepID=A0AAD5S4N4_9PEZI|nr:Stress responsive A/B Barrel domain-containing protein [Zalerion maritima]